ncbi:unnamed protein product [Sympodiomycopsis kandeliae]
MRLWGSTLKLRAFTLLCAFAYTSTSAAPNPFVDPTPVSAAQIAGKTYDFVIIGGGTAGLTVATRLSELNNVTIAVLEAGDSHLGDEVVEMPGKMGYPLGNTHYDWSYQTAPQSHAYNLTFNWSRGKGLGGSSAINFMIGNRGSRQEYDAWEKLGNTGWNWKTLFPYFRKAEHFEPLQNHTFAKYWNETYEASSHGTQGPLKTSPSLWQTDSLRYWFSTGDTFGLPPYTTEAYAGSPLGQYTTLNFARIDRQRRVRSYAANAYWASLASRRANLVVATRVPVEKIHLEGIDGAVRATAAQLTTGQLVRARREIILSAGAIVSPQILELSGIGNKSILDRYGIPTVVDLPGVGENLQDRPYTLQSFELTPQAWVTAENATQDTRYREQAERLWRMGENSFYSFAPTWVAYIPFSNMIADPQLKSLAAAQEREPKHALPVINGQFLLQQRWIQGTRSFAKDIPAVELLFYPGIFPHITAENVKSDRNYLTIMAELQHPFFRGSIHINSTDSSHQPVIDPHYFEYEYDTKLVTAMAKLVRTFAHTPPLRNIIARNHSPTSKVKTDDQWTEFAKRNLFSSAHAIGTCAMGHRERGGVTDTELRVHGTINLRVVDVSVFPLQTSCHPSMTLCAVAERAADIIKRSAAAAHGDQA